jgi:hypothetical protein
MLRQQGVMQHQNYVHLQIIKLRALSEITSLVLYPWKASKFQNEAKVVFTAHFIAEYGK